MENLEPENSEINEKQIKEEVDLRWELSRTRKVLFAIYLLLLCIVMFTSSEILEPLIIIGIVFLCASTFALVEKIWKKIVYRILVAREKKIKNKIRRKQ